MIYFSLHFLFQIIRCLSICYFYWHRTNNWDLYCWKNIYSSLQSELMNIWFSVAVFSQIVLQLITCMHLPYSNIIKTVSVTGFMVSVSLWKIPGLRLRRIDYFVVRERCLPPYSYFTLITVKSRLFKVSGEFVHSCGRLLLCLDETFFLFVLSNK